MKTVRIHQYGGAEALRYEDVSLDPPAKGQALIRHTAIGVNFIDVYFRTGLYPLPSLPHGIGMEGAGVVEAIGEGVTTVKPGDRVVCAAGPPGAYAEKRLMDAGRLVPIPSDISDELAAAILLKGMTAEFLIRRCFQVKRGDVVLFHAAAGGVGTIATQWLAHLGATVIGTVGSEEKAELAKKNGVAHPIIYTKEDFVLRVKEITGGQGVAVAYDSVGKSTFAKNFDCVRPRGMVVSFGNASGKPDPIDPLVLSQKGSLFLTRPTLFHYVATREELLASASALFEAVRSGSVKVELEHRWKLAEAAEAHRALEGRATTGPILLLP